MTGKFGKTCDSTSPMFSVICLKSDWCCFIDFFCMFDYGHQKFCQGSVHFQQCLTWSWSMLDILPSFENTSQIQLLILPWQSPTCALPLEPVSNFSGCPGQSPERPQRQTSSSLIHHFHHPHLTRVTSVKSLEGNLTHQINISQVSKRHPHSPESNQSSL